MRLLCYARNDKLDGFFGHNFVWLNFQAKYGRFWQSSQKKIATDSQIKKCYKQN